MIRGQDPAEATRALDELCRIYWPAVFAFVLRVVRDEKEAEDVTQEFFLDILALRRMETADRNSGKFRTYLLTHLQFFLKDHLRKRRSQKRGGHIVHVAPEETSEAEMPVTLPETSHFDVSWATAVVKEAIRLLALEFEPKSGEISFEEMKGFLPGFQSMQTASYSELSGRYQISEATIRVRVNRFRGRFRELLNAVLADTVGSAADLESERQSLLGGMLKSLG